MAVSPARIYKDADASADKEDIRSLTQPERSRLRLADARPSVRSLYGLSNSTREGFSVVGGTSHAAPELEREFYALAKQWRSETAHLSLAIDKANHFAYHQIIGMGKNALPIIFRELDTKASDWFWALRAITRTSPIISPEDRGKVRRIAAAWLEWGRQHGYVTR